MMHRSITIFGMLFAFMLLAMSSVVQATCPNIPAGGIYCIPITIPNTAGTTLTQNTPLEFNFNTLNYQTYLAANVQNIEIYNSLSGTIITSQIFGNTANFGQTTSLNTINSLAIFFKNPDNIASSTNDLNLEIAVFPTGSNMFSTSNGVCGGAWLTTSYGVYDCGGKIMTQYDDIAGTTLPSNYLLTSGGTGLTINNGYTNAGGGSGTCGTGWTCVSGATSYDPSLYSLDTIGYSTKLATRDSITGWGTNPTGAAGMYWSAGGAGGNYILDGAADANVVSSTTLSSFSTWTVSTNVYGSLNYGMNLITSTGYVAGTGQFYFNGALLGDAGNTYSQAIFVRKIPAGGSMPIITTGVIVSAAPLTLTISPNPTNYGTNSLVTATCSPGTDTCSVKNSPSGPALCSSTGSCSFTANYIAYGVGAYCFQANDITLGTNTVCSTLTINSVPQIISINNCTNQAWTSPTLGYSCTTTATFPSLFNQVAGNLLLNGGIVGTSNSVSNSVSYTISNSINQNIFCANTLATANYLANALCRQWIGYVPISVQNSSAKLTLIPTNTALTSASNTVTGWHNPFMFYTQSPSNSIRYTLSNALNSNAIANVVGQANVLNISYLPDPNNEITGQWIYQVAETQYGNTIVANQFLNSLTQNIVYGTTTNGIYTCIQYYPCFADNGLSFYSQPTSYKIDGSSNTIIGTNIIKGTNSPTNLILNYQLIYSQFSPTFNMNLTTPLGLTTNSLNVIPFKIIASNVVPAAPYTSNVFNLSTYDEGTFNALLTTTQFSISANLNNYTISNQTSTNAWTSWNVYIPKSNFQNPSMYAYSITSSSTNGAYFPAQNNFCPTTLNATNPTQFFKIYLVSFATGQSTTINLLSNSAGANNGQFIRLLLGANPLFATAVQQIIISTQTFRIPLIVGDSYAAAVVSAKCQQIYQTPAAPQDNPWFINIPQNINVTKLLTPLINATCTVGFNSLYSANAVTCRGRDTNNLVYLWNASIYNQTGFVNSGLHLLASNAFNSNTFAWTYYPVSLAHGALSYKIVYYWNPPADPVGSKSGILNNIVVSGYNTPLDTLLTVIFLLVGIAAGMRLEEKHKLSATLFIEAFILFILYMAGLTSWLGPIFNGALICFLLAIGLLGMRDEGKNVLGG